MAIQISGTTVIDNSRNINAGIGTFTRLDVPPQIITFSPTNGATEVASNTNIIITFNQIVTKGTGNITLRNSSGIGTVLETIAVSAGVVGISGGTVTINPVNLMPSSTNVFVVVDAGAFVGLTTSSTNQLLDDYNFTVRSFNLGDSYEGGFIICCASPLRWVVAPSASEISRNWFSRSDANTLAQQVSGCTGWFVPTCGQLQNPGFICREFWQSAKNTCYWSDTESPFVSPVFGPGCSAFQILFDGGGFANAPYKTYIRCVRAFRCVTY